MGLYPVTPGLPFNTITSPVFEKITINLSNGKEINTPFITHKQIMAGATLELILDELPNKECGSNAKIPATDE